MVDHPCPWLDETSRAARTLPSWAGLQCPMCPTIVLIGMIARYTCRRKCGHRLRFEKVKCLLLVSYIREACARDPSRSRDADNAWSIVQSAPLHFLWRVAGERVAFLIRLDLAEMGRSHPCRCRCDTSRLRKSRDEITMY
ncbi:hypothetical protein MRB53_040850 [Persea americana]|nr:hypothetical protein MRB53_040850 [Persea americana]